MREALRSELEPIIPARMRARPIDPRGYSVPWFVAEIDGEFDFRVIGPGKWARAIRFRVCWLCGEPLGRLYTFCIGPMCMVNRITSEPPSHTECAEYAAKACPFMTRPLAQYRTANTPEGTHKPPGVGLTHNPTAVVLWTAHGYSIVRCGDGALISLGDDPDALSFWTKGRHATRAEVLEAMRVGFPKLLEAANAQGGDAPHALELAVARAMPLLPGDPEPDEVPLL